MSYAFYFEGEGSIWDTIKKEKIATFVTNNRSTTVMIDNRLVTIREERKLMNRLLVASRSRPDIDLCECLGTYEFTVTPPSLFCPDGTMHPKNDKSVIAEQLFQLQADETPVMEEDVVETNDIRKVIIIDGMAVVNRVNIKKSNIKSCADFSKCFLYIIDKEVADFDEVRVIFDHYKHDSLKNKTRSGRTKGRSSVQYKVLDSTKIEHPERKEFLSSIETKEELTKYLSGKLNHHLSKDFVIVLNGNVTSNMSDLDENLLNYNHEEADTGIVLHAIDVTKRGRFSELVILCSTPKTGLS